MDKYDFRKIDLRVLSSLEDWNPQATNQEPPNPTELIPIGEWNDFVVPGVNIIVDSDYVAWLEVPNLEYDCEVIIN